MDPIPISVDARHSHEINTDYPRVVTQRLAVGDLAYQFAKVQVSIAEDFAPGLDALQVQEVVDQTCQPPRLDVDKVDVLLELIARRIAGQDEVGEANNTG